MTPKKSIYWLLLALDLLLAAGLLWGSWSYANKKAALGATLRQSAELEAGRLNQAAAEAALTKTAADRAKLDAYFINPENLSVFIEALEKTASAAGVSANLAAARVDGKSEPVARFSLEIGGTYGQIFRYLHLVENLPFIASVRQLQLDANPPAAKGREATWRASLTIELKSLELTKNESSS